MRRGVVACVLACVLALVHAQCPHETGTKWNLATSGDIVITSKVVLDRSLTVNTISIQNGGELVFDEQDISLTAKWIRVDNGGGFTIGSESCPFQHKAIITLTGPRTTTSDMGQEPTDNIDLGAKGIAIRSGGSLELHGRKSAVSWTRLSSTANAGATSITVADNIDWKVGDSIVIASTDFSAIENLIPDQSENFTIQAITGRTITLDRPLGYMHWGVGYEKAEVGLLTRNIVIQGDASSTTDGFGGHVMIRVARSVHIEGVEFTRMGQAGILGRYPVHFHLLKDVTTKGFYIRDCSIHHNFQRCVAIHDSAGVMVANNVAYDTRGHCYFLEDGPESLNTFNKNLGILARAVKANSGQQIIPSDKQPTMFWITNPNNTFTNNVAVGAFFGFWFSLPERATGAGEPVYRDDPWMYPRFLPLLRFSDNTAHSNEDNGLHIDDMLEQDGTTPLASYNPRKGPYNAYPINELSWRLEGVVAHYENFVGYKNRGYGIWVRGNFQRFTNAWLADNTNGLQMVPGPNIAEDCVIIGETANVGTEFNYWGMPSYGRARPVYWTNAYPIRGFENYDSGGPQFLRRIRFENFVPNSLRPAGAIGILRNGPNMLFAQNRYRELSFTNCNEFYTEFWPNPTSEDTLENDGPKGIAVLDQDGTITGSMGSWIVSDEPFLYDSSCTAKPTWNARICPKTQEGYTFLQVNNLNTAGTDFGSTVTDEDYIRATWYHLGDTTGQRKLEVTGGEVDEPVRDRYSTIAKPRHGYTIRFDHPTPPEIELVILGAAKGDWAVIAIPYPQTTFTVVTGYDNSEVVPVDSISKLSKNTYYYDAASQHLYIFVQNTYDSLAEIWGFSYHESWSSYTRVTAGCGRTCLSGGSMSLPIPPALPELEDKYEASLSGCTQVVPVSSANSGHAFFSYDPRNHLLSYTIYHSSDNVIKAHIHKGEEGANGQLEIQLESGLSPLRGQIALSRNRHIDLWRGDWYVNLHTEDYPAGELRGQIGCKGICSAPVRVSDQPACQPAGASIPIYSEGLAGNWSSWSWGGAGLSLSFNSTTTPLCGSRVISLGLNGSAAMSLHKDRGALTIDTSQYFATEFYARSAGEAIDLVVRWDQGDEVRAQWQHITNFVIENTWTRVRIPFADMGLSGSVTIERLDIYQFESWANPPIAFFIDEIRIVAQGSEPLTPPLSGGAAPYATTPCTPVVGGEGGCTDAKCFARDANSVCNANTLKCQCGTGYALSHLGICEDSSAACENVNCDVGDVNSHCEGGACVCNTGFTLEDGKCAYTGAEADNAVILAHSAAVVAVMLVALLF